MKTINVTAAIFIDGKKIYSAQRGYGKFQGYWEFPGGKIESGETPEQALKREIQEELGCNITIKEHFMDLAYNYPDFHLQLHAYLCCFNHSAPTLLEHKNAKWLDHETLYSVEWLPANQGLIEKLEQYLCSLTPDGKK